MYNFDKIIDRTGTNCVKWDAVDHFFGVSDLIPLWVADMDFETPDFIRQVLAKRLEHPVYGYTIPPQSYWQSLIDWQKSHHQWDVKQEWLSYIPGIVKGIGLVELCFTQPGDGVVIQPPVYHPFRLVTEHNGRRVLNNPLHFNGRQYQMDFVQLETLFRTENCKILLLSNPHNPSGRVWSTDTLRRLAALCARYGVLVVSDEIHADMAFAPHKHVPYAMSCAQARENSITFAAPSKTFNIAGIVSSYAVVPNDSIRKKFYDFLQANELADAPFMATIATEAAFENGEVWRVQMLSYVAHNVSWVKEFFAKHIPAVKVIEPQASFLVWLDCRELATVYGITDIPRFFMDAGLGLNDGEMFGKEGRGFMRLNVGTPLSVLQKAFEKLLKHFTEYTGK